MTETYKKRMRAAAKRRVSELVGLSVRMMASVVLTGGDMMPQIVVPYYHAGWYTRDGRMIGRQRPIESRIMEGAVYRPATRAVVYIGAEWIWQHGEPALREWVYAEAPGWAMSLDDEERAREGGYKPVGANHV